MKRTALLMALLLYSLTWFLSAALPAGRSAVSEGTNGSAIVLPAALVEIGESAFENTAAETVVIPSLVSTIRDRAFANNTRLTLVRIPESVSSIGDQTFRGSPHVKLQGAENSYAAIWAQAHNVAFVQTETFVSYVLKLANLFRKACILSLSFGFIRPATECWQRRRTKRRIISLRPQDRPELNPIDYKFP